MPTVWPLEADARESLKERVTFPADVRISSNTTEQRASLREVPAGEIEFANLATTPRERTLAAGLIQANQGAEWAVPAWQFGQRLASSVSAGASIVPCSTANIPWAWHPLIPQPYAVLWRSPFSYELVRVASLTGSQLNLVAPLASSRAAGTVIAPARRARMDSAEPLRHFSRAVSSARLHWTIEEFPGTAGTVLAGPSLAMSTYQSLRVLEEMPQPADAQDEQLERRLLVGDETLGIRTVYVGDAAPAASRSIELSCTSRALAYQVLGFVYERLGRVVPFWMPSWYQDLEMSVDGASGNQFIRVLEVGYAARMFSGTGARRHIRLRHPDGTKIDRKVTSAVNNGDGTETLSLDATLGQAVPRSLWVPLFLRLGRLNDDAVEFEWLNGSTARVSMSVREIPTEAPL
jgi:hypothetical protein